jgi:copper chaperone
MSEVRRQIQTMAMSHTKGNATMATTVLTVPDISCEHCVRSVTNALTPVDGVQDVQIDIPTKQVTVAYDNAKVDVEQMKAILAEEDYPVASVAG